MGSGIVRGYTQQVEVMANRTRDKQFNVKLNKDEYDLVKKAINTAYGRGECTTTSEWLVEAALRTLKEKGYERTGTRRT